MDQHPYHKGAVEFYPELDDKMFWTPVGLTYILAPLDNLIFFSFKNKVKKYHRKHGIENEGNYSMNN